MSVNPAAAAAISDVLGIPAPNDPATPEKPAGDGQPKLFAGKWKTEEALNEGVHKLIAHANEMETRARNAEAMLAKASSGAQEDAVKKFSDDIGADTNLTTAAVRAIAMQALEEMVQPALKATQADQRLIETYGAEYAKAIPDVNAFVAANPQVKALVDEALATGNPALGKAYAYEMYLKDQASKEDKRLLDGDAARREAVENARPDARTTVERRSMGARARTTGRAALSQEQIGAIVERAQQGDWSLFDKHIMRPTLPPEEVLQRMIGNL